MIADVCWITDEFSFLFKYTREFIAKCIALTIANVIAVLICKVLSISVALHALSVANNALDAG